jgi:hypothetical protein
MAGLPAFLNLVEIDLEQLLPVAQQHVDSDFREPKTTKLRAVVRTLEGQVNYGSKKFLKLDPTRTGDREDSFGWLVFEKAYLVDLGVTIQKGDRIIRIASQTVNHLVTEVRPESPLEGDFLLMYVEFGIPRDLKESVPA